MPKPPPRDANAPVAAEAFKTKNQTSKQRDFRADASQAQAPATKHFKQPTNWETLSLGYKTKWLVQRTSIHPPALKLLAVNLADHVDSKTGHAWPSIALLAIECSVTTTHIKRLLNQAKSLNLIEVVSKGGGATSTRYRFPFQQLGLSYHAPSGKSISEGVVKKLRGGHDVPGTSMYPVHGCAPTRHMDVPPLGTPMCHKPHEPQNPSFGGEGLDLPSGRASPSLSPVPGIPEYVNGEVWVELMAEQRKKLDPLEILKQAKRYHDAGATNTAIAAGLDNLLLHPHWINLTVEIPKAQPTGKRRTTGRARALLIEPGRDTRAAGRDYK
jgi:hypothetical protein